jgi:hypothetical protein
MERLSVNPIFPSPFISFRWIGYNELEAADLIRQGISGVILKHSPPEELSESIHKTLAGKVWFEQAYLKRVMERTAASEKIIPTATIFTERERQVLSLVFEGLAQHVHIGTPPPDKTARIAPVHGIVLGVFRNKTADNGIVVSGAVVLQSQLGIKISSRIAERVGEYLS